MKGVRLAGDERADDSDDDVEQKALLRITMLAIQLMIPPTMIEITQLAAICFKRRALRWGKATSYPLDVSDIRGWRPED